MKFINKTKILSFLPQILGFLFLAGFVAYAWTEPPYGGPCSNPPCPPGGNAPAPINVGSAAQTKQGDLTIGGALRVDGNLLDKLGRVIYNAATGKIERARLPFEQGDITSDVDTNTYDGSYFNVSNLIPANVVKGLAFGRNQTGTATKMLTNEIGAYGQVGRYTGTGINGSCDFNNDCLGPWMGVHFDSVGSLNEYDPRNILDMTISGTSGCYTGFPGACSFQWLDPRPNISCASSGWLYYSGRPFGGYCGPQTVCGYCALSY